MPDLDDDSHLNRRTFYVPTYKPEQMAAIRETFPEKGYATGIPIGDLWVLLATINDLPVKIEEIKPAKGYVARGRYRRFLAHKVITLTVPETRYRKLVLRTAALLRRRAHQVRGHWRLDWIHPPSTRCEHLWQPDGKHLVCSRCSGHKIWIAEHQRGDASIGFVTHDYTVERERA
jgi:hypothetical protein